MIREQAKQQADVVDAGRVIAKNPTTASLVAFRRSRARRQIAGLLLALAVHDEAHPTVGGRAGLRLLLTDRPV
jgi:hypothetical protein